MARPLRIYVPGAWYHVTARGNERRDIFRDEADRQRFLAQLGAMVERYRVRLYAYVLMNNHYHLLLEPSEGNLSRALQWLNASYSQWFNRRHRRSGHLLEGRFQSRLVEAERWGLELSRYVHLNPIRTGRQGLDKKRREGWRRGVGRAVKGQAVADRVEQLLAYRWSSYPAYVGLADCPAWLSCDRVLGLIGGPKRERREAYQCYVEQGAQEGMEPSPWEQLKGQVVLGEESFVNQLQDFLKGDEREQAGLRQLRS
ncbi:MAG TPA: transposase, partial [Terriglobia bacterium]|nr:transposase [Terriglobia bacterium]